MKDIACRHPHASLLLEQRAHCSCSMGSMLMKDIACRHPHASLLLEQRAHCSCSMGSMLMKDIACRHPHASLLLEQRAQCSCSMGSMLMKDIACRHPHASQALTGPGKPRVCVLAPHLAACTSKRSGRPARPQAATWAGSVPTMLTDVACRHPHACSPTWQPARPGEAGGPLVRKQQPEAREEGVARHGAARHGGLRCHGAAWAANGALVCGKEVGSLPWGGTAWMPAVP